MHALNVLGQPSHLKRLEAEAIYIVREVAAQFDNPVLLYSMGKDSSVLLHILLKAFYPAKPPMPLLQVDTGWTFQELLRFRDQRVREIGMELIVHVNQEALDAGLDPFEHGSSVFIDAMKTQGLKQALDRHGFDAALGGARRDEEKSRAKERIFSFRNAMHHWDPKNQRPELWNLYNGRLGRGQSVRAFPLSNWTELDIWLYIYSENIAVPSLYLATERPVVERDGTLIIVDDKRFPLQPGEIPQQRKVRCRTLCEYPFTGAIESEADTLPKVLREILAGKSSERAGRVIDRDAVASMEKKKVEGYF